jgi:hypothetical protein
VAVNVERLTSGINDRAYSTFPLNRLKGDLCFMFFLMSPRRTVFLRALLTNYRVTFVGLLGDLIFNAVDRIFLLISP